MLIFVFASFVSAFVAAFVVDLLDFIPTSSNCQTADLFNQRFMYLAVIYVTSFVHFYISQSFMNSSVITA